MKKILSLVLALMMILGMVAAFAEVIPEPEGMTADGNISIEGLDVGDVVNFYKVIEWGWANAEHTTGGWVLTAPFASNSAMQTLLASINAGFNTPYELTEADVNAIVNVIVAEGFSGTATSVEATATTLTQTVDPGMYLALVTPVTPGTIYNPLVVSADYEDGNTTNVIGHNPDLEEATVGKNSYKVKKKPNEVTKTTADTDKAIAQAIDSYVGEPVDFYVETYIPSYLDSYKDPTFYVEDYILTDGIDYTEGSIEIKLGDEEGAEYIKTQETAQYKITEKPDDNGYRVDFKSAYLTQNRAPVKLYIHYTGVVTNTAEFNINRDYNDVTVVYTNGPDEELTALRDVTNHYTFSIGAKAFGQESGEGHTFELIKVQADANGDPIYSDPIPVSDWYTQTERHPLAGAKFGLYTDESCAEQYRYKLGQYSNTTNYPDGAEYTTDGSGIISFYGLAEGTYWIKELSAPAGYVKDTRAAKVEIDANYIEKTEPAKKETIDGKEILVAGYKYEVLDYYEVKVNNVSIYKSDDDQYVDNGNNIVDTKYEFDNLGPHTMHMTTTKSNDSELVNPKGVELPSTGGMGTTILYIGGSALVLLAVIFLVTKRRMKAED